MSKKQRADSNDWFNRLVRLQPWYLLTRYPTRLSRSVFAFVCGGTSIAIMSVAALYTQQPLLFPSLGPSAFLFFYKPTASSASPRNAVLAHGAGIMVGWLAWTLIGTDTSFEKTAAAALSLSVLSALMIAANIAHPPAASTALLVSLGMITEIPDLIALMAAVVMLTLQAILINRLSGVSYPFWKASSAKGELVASALQTGAVEKQDVYAKIADQLVARRKVAGED